MRGDESCKKFWRENFGQKENLKVEVDFSQFFSKLSKYIIDQGQSFYTTETESSRNKEVECINAIFADNKSLVHVDRYGLVFDWFGSLIDEESNILSRILNICKSEWFFGDIDREIAEKMLTKNKNFVVRFCVPKKENYNENPPVHERPFSITYKFEKKDAPINTRVFFKNNEYSTIIQRKAPAPTQHNSKNKPVDKKIKDKKDKKDKEKIHKAGTLIDLIEEIKAALTFTIPNGSCSKYHNYFQESEFGSYLGDEVQIANGESDIESEEDLGKVTYLNDRKETTSKKKNI